MKVFASILLAITISGCATSSNSFDRNNIAWANTIIGCQSAAELVGTKSDKKVWAYEKRALLTDRNGGWPSDSARLGNAVKKNTKQLLNSGTHVASQNLTKCSHIIDTFFPDGHPVA